MSHLLMSFKRDSSCREIMSMQGVKILDLENIKRDGLQMELLLRKLRDAVQRRDMDTCNTGTAVLKI